MFKIATKLPLFCLLLSSLLITNTFAAQPLPPDRAFQLYATVGQDHRVFAHWKIAPGYYLYRGKFHFSVVSPKNITVDKIQIPKGILQTDQFLGPHQVFFDHVSVPVSFLHLPKQLQMKITYQGCSSHGFCYPPITKTLSVDFDAGTASVASLQSSPVSEQDQITALLSEHHLWIILAAFFGFGLLLSVTPCVLPMIPILTSVIVNHGHTIKTGRAFVLSLSYVLGMAIMFAIAGVAAGLVGQSLQVALQTPWVLVLSSLFFVVLALSLFGLYELQMPEWIRSRVSALSQRQQHGQLFGVAVMGALSTLIVSPCVSAPLIGALGYIGKTGDAWLGGIALFVMGLGMGVPLIIVGTLGGKLLPKAGNWMYAVKALFGIMLLGMAIWLVERVLPGRVIMLCWAALGIFTAVYAGAFSQAPTRLKKCGKVIGLFVFIYAIVLIVGALQGNTNPLNPLSLNGKTTITTKKHSLPFQRIKTVSDLQQALEKAKQAKKPVMLDFYADWCISCKIMEATTFADPSVQVALKDYILLQADVTQNDKTDQALMQCLHIIAPPAILFFDNQGQLKPNATIVGEMSAKVFVLHVEDVTRSESASPSPPGLNRG